MKFKLLFITIVVLINGGCIAPQHRNISEFDTVCNIAAEAIVQSNESNLRTDYISKNIKDRVDSKDVLESMELIWQVNPEKRYQVYKEAVENNLGRGWECPALETFFEDVN